MLPHRFKDDDPFPKQHNPPKRKGGNERVTGRKAAAAAAAKSLQSCLTLCDPIDSSPPSSPIPEILQARTLEWVAISFSNAWKWKVKVKSLSCVRFSNPIYCSPPGSSIHGIFQARVLEMTNLDSILRSRDITFSTKVHLVKAMVFPVIMYGCESWTVKKVPKNWWFCTVVLDKTPESPLDCMEIQPVHPKGDQS